MISTKLGSFFNTNRQGKMEYFYIIEKRVEKNGGECT